MAARALLAGPPGRRALAVAAAVGALWCAGYPLAAGQTFSAPKLAAAAAVYGGTLLCVWARGAGRARMAAAALAVLAAADMTANNRAGAAQV